MRNEKVEMRNEKVEMRNEKWGSRNEKWEESYKLTKKYIFLIPTYKNELLLV